MVKSTFPPDLLESGVDSEYEEMAGQRVSRDPAQVAARHNYKQTDSQTNKQATFGPIKTTLCPQACTQCVTVINVRSSPGQVPGHTSPHYHLLTTTLATPHHHVTTPRLTPPPADPPAAAAAAAAGVTW